MPVSNVLPAAAVLRHPRAPSPKAAGVGAPSPAAPSSLASHEALSAFLEHRAAEEPGVLLREAVNAGLDALPQPASGETLARWRALAIAARRDLSFAKLYEGHADARAIVAELATRPAAPGAWGVWAAEMPCRGLRIDRRSRPFDAAEVVLHGTKAWCSGADAVDHALVTAWHEASGPWLVAVDLRQPGVRVPGPDHAWQAIGMAATRTATVTFDAARGVVVGSVGAYLERAGFWHGGAGIAACWYGGACALMDEFAAHLGNGNDANRLAHFGAALAAMGAAAASLREAAHWIDRHPRENAQALALRTRAIVEDAALRTLDHAGKALGAAAFCLNARFARAAADLPVFLRQSHAERDLAALATIASRHPRAWTL